MACYETKVELCITAGDDVTLPFRMLDSAGVAVDVTGYVFNLDSSDDSIDKLGVIGVAANGEFSFSYSRAETSAITSNKVSAKITYEVGGVLTTITYATVTIVPEV